MTEEQIKIAFNLIASKNDLKTALDILRHKPTQKVGIFPEDNKYGARAFIQPLSAADLIPLVQDKMDNTESTLRTLGITTS